MPQPELFISLSIPVNEGVEPKALDEPLELALRHRAFVEIHEMRADATLGKKSLRFSCFRAFPDSKDLDFHLVSGRLLMPRSGDASFEPAWWLRNAHAQTIWGKIARRPGKHRTRVERLTAPDGDSLELHHLDPVEFEGPRVLLLHGLEGSPRSHYVAGVFSESQRRGWGATLLVFRGCGSAANIARRFYHSGETRDVAFVFETLSSRWPSTPWLLAAVSLGGNVLLKWLGELGELRSPDMRAAAAVSVPFDLEAGARYISQGFARVYDRNFLRSLRRKAMAKLERYPDLFDREALDRAKTIFDFDDVVTAPVHGFVDAVDYYSRSSSIGFLERIRVPTLLLSAIDDPFLPRDVLTRVKALSTRNPALALEFAAHGGHVGFVGGKVPWKPFYYAEQRVFRFFDAAMERRDLTSYD